MLTSERFEGQMYCALCEEEDSRQSSRRPGAFLFWELGGVPVRGLSGAVGGGLTCDREHSWLTKSAKSHGSLQ